MIEHFRWLNERWEAVAGNFRTVASVFRRLWVYAFCSALASFAVSGIVGQSAEAIRILASGPAGGATIWAGVTTTLGFVAFTIAVWYGARVETYIEWPAGLGGQSGFSHESRTVVLVPRVLGILPAASFGLGAFFQIWGAWPQEPAVALGLSWLAASAFAFVTLALVLLHHRRPWLDRLGGWAEELLKGQGGAPGTSDREKDSVGLSSKLRAGVAQAMKVVAGPRKKPPKERRQYLGLYVIAGAVALAGLVVVGLLPQVVAVRLGPLATILITVAFWQPILVGLSLATKLLRLIAPVWLLVFVLTNWCNCSTLHNVHSVAGPVGQGGPMSAATAFDGWLSTRKDRERDKGPYPVFFVAAEGGGIRNAYLTATVLGTLQDRNPSFAHHTFAISGVSGGSVGAAGFASLLRAFPPREPSATGAPFENSIGYHDHARLLFSQDLLSPVLATMLAGEAFGLLTCGLSGRDRGRELELSINRAWSEMVQTSHPDASAWQRNLAAEPFESLWEDPSNTCVPFLMLNATHAATGERVVAGPFSIVDNDPAPVPALPHGGKVTILSEIHPGLRIALSTAAVLSARFPGVSSAGVMEDATGKLHRYVDGGYFENSGAKTLDDLLAVLDETGVFEREDILPVIIRINIYANPSARKGPAELWESSAFTEARSPIDALLNARSARGTTAIVELDTWVVGSKDARLLTFRLVTGTRESGGSRRAAPLGWMLSEENCQMLSNFTLDPDADTRRLLVEVDQLLRPIASG